MSDKTHKGKIRFAIAGLGLIGHKHLNTILQHADAELVAICDEYVTPDKGLDIPHYADIELMLNRHPEIDVVNICTPNGLHAKHAIQCIKAGKHVVIEKPMCLTKSDAESVIFHALDMHVKVFCVMQNRYAPVALWLKDLIKNHRLGKILDISLNLFWNRDERYYKLPNGDAHPWHGALHMDGGPLFTQFSHFIDLLYWLFGNITIEDAYTSNLNHPYVGDIEDAGNVTFRTHDHALGSIRYSINAPFNNIESNVLIVGTEGAVKVSGQYLENIEYAKLNDSITLPYNDGDNKANHSYVMDNVITSLLAGTGGNISTNAMEGLKVVEIIESIYQKAIRK